ncbi:MAG: molybdopterin-dependent oxidoreductase [Chitinophagaceae bacterium]|nr:molybdopterin-dependent oxidoreductase [Chitinophagaceae bacterium]
MENQWNQRISEQPRHNANRKLIIAFIVFLILGAAAVYGWQVLKSQPTDNGALKPLRKVLNANEKLFTSTFSNKLSASYPTTEAVSRVRVNGNYGLKDPVDSSGWKLNIVRSAGDTLKLTLEDIKKLPKKDVVFDFKCIEGWSQVTHWSGVSLKELLKYYHLTEQVKENYLGLQTPDKGYYVGIDMQSVLHPQTILAYEMNGKPLPLNQGYPLRLIIPVKYGIKHLKRIGTMFFSDQKPPDYWAERGYDYYAGF